jgi:hypothetical protein
MSANIKVPRELFETVSMGQRGFDWIDNTSARTGDWMVLMPLTDVVVSSLTTDDNTPHYLNGTLQGSLSGKTLSKGIPLFGRFTAVTLTSGTLVAYRV